MIVVIVYLALATVGCLLSGDRYLVLEFYLFVFIAAACTLVLHFFIRRIVWASALAAAAYYVVFQVASVRNLHRVEPVIALGLVVTAAFMFGLAYLTGVLFHKWLDRRTKA